MDQTQHGSYFFGDSYLDRIWNTNTHSMLDVYLLDSQKAPEFIPDGLVSKVT